MPAGAVSLVLSTLDEYLEISRGNLPSAKALAGGKAGIEWRLLPPL